MKLQKKRVCVIGTGPSGITALKNLRDEGIEAVAFDKNDQVGGNWIFSENESHSSVFETTHIISSKTLSQYEDFTFNDFDPNVADYPSHDELRRYFQAYAQHFDLYPHIQFNTEVVHCKYVDETQWEITLRRNHQEWQETFTDLVVCNGHHWNPRLPTFSGTFAGEFLHSHQYKKAEPFRNKRILVIGGGNSACDVAVETSRVSAKTCISWRLGYKIIPKFIFGLPSDVFAERTKWLPIGIRARITDRLLTLVVGKNEAIGLQKAESRFGQTHPTINDELIYRIRHGKIHPKVNISHFEGNTVHFEDGSSETFDTIIACTGFKITHPFFDQSFVDYSEGKVPLYLKMLHPTYRNLYFIGLFQPLGCIWPGAELQSKIMARELAGKWQRPSQMAKAVERELKNPHYRQIDTPRHTITVDYHLFRKTLLKELPKDYIQKERRRVNA